MTKINIKIENRGFVNNPDIDVWFFRQENVSPYSSGNNALSFNKISLAIKNLTKSQKISCVVDEQSYRNLKADQAALRIHSPSLSNLSDKIVVFNCGEKTVFIEPSSKLKNEALLFGFPENAFSLNSISVDSPQVQLNINTDFADLSITPIEFGKIIDIENYV